MRENAKETPTVGVGTKLPIGTVTTIRRDGVEVDFSGTRIVASFKAVEEMIKEKAND